MLCQCRVELWSRLYSYTDIFLVNVSSSNTMRVVQYTVNVYCSNSHLFVGDKRLVFCPNFEQSFLGLTILAFQAVIAPVTNGRILFSTVD